MDVLDRSTIWPYDEHGEPRAFSYARYGSPTVAPAALWADLEPALERA